MHLVQSKHPFVERRQDGQQHIRVMLDLIQVKVIFVIVVGGLVGVQVFLQLRLHPAVGGLGPGQVRVLGEIGGCHQAGSLAPEHGSAGLHQPHDEHEDQADPSHNEKGVFVLRHKPAQLLGDGPAAFLRCGSGGLGCLSRSLGRAGSCPMCGGILLLQPLFLPQAGDGVTGRKLGIFHDGLPPVEIGIGFHRCLLRLFHIPPGFQFPVRACLMDTPAAIAHGLLDLPLPQVAGLDAGANDYLSKPFHLAELEARIRSLTLRQFTQHDVVLSCGALTFDTKARLACAGGQPVSLTRKETGIMEYLMLHQGRPVSQEELMEHVWDNSVDNFSNSIRVHISSLRKKLRAALGYDPILNRIGEGYLMGGPEL